MKIKSPLGSLQIANYMRRMNARLSLRRENELKSQYYSDNELLAPNCIESAKGSDR